MKAWLKLITLSAGIFSLGGCTCGFDCSSDGDDPSDTVAFTLGFSDAPAENLKEVVLEIDTVTLISSDGDDEVIERFNISQTGVVNGDSFEIDLLKYQGADQLIVIDDRDVSGGEYSRIVIDVRDGDSNNSYVIDSEDRQHDLEVKDGRISLSGIFLSKEREVHTIEFNLARSLSYDPSREIYSLDDVGIRWIEDSHETGMLSGALDEELFDAGECDLENNPLQGIRVYLYEGGSVDAGDLADVIDQENNPDKVAPYAVAAFKDEETVFGNYRYEFGFLPEGQYTVAFSCDAEGDDPEDLDDDDITIPSPAGQIYRVFVEEDEETFCDIVEDSNGECAGSIQ